MKNKIIIFINFLVLFIVFGFSVIQQENYQKQSGFYLKLTPVDPRSLLQGDYMELNYEICDRALEDIRKNNMSKGYINIKIDKNKIGQYISISEKPQNKNISAYFAYNGIKLDININSFMFQEGKGYIYSKAQYSEVVCIKNKLRLKKLLDKDFKSL